MTKEQKGVCAICFCEVTETEVYETPIARNKGVRVKRCCNRCEQLIKQAENDHDLLLRAACFVIVQKAGLDDIRIGYKLLFEESQRQEKVRMNIIRKRAQEQLCQAIQQLPVNAEEDSPTVEPAVQETFTLRDLGVLKKA